MPVRLVRDGILTSTKVNRLTLDEEVFYRRLMSVVDDYGRYEAHAALLRASLYPLRIDRVRESSVERWLLRCSEVGLVDLYVVEGKRYLEISNFRQQTRSPSKCPDRLNSKLGVKNGLLSDATQPLSDATQMLSDATQMLSDATQMKTFVHLDGDVSEGVSEGEGDICSCKQLLTKAKPSAVDEVKDYFEGIGSTTTEAEGFFDHYEARGWRLAGKTQMKDWRAAARTWLRRSGDFKVGLGVSGKKSSSGGAALWVSQPKPEETTVVFGAPVVAEQEGQP